MARHLAIVVFPLLFAAPAMAHPVPALTYDRTVRIKLTPAGVEVTYRLELNDYTMLLDAAQIISDEQRAALKPGNAIRDVFMEALAPHLADRLEVWQDDRPLTFTCTDRKWKIDDHLYCDFTFSAPWAASPAGGGKLRVTVRKPQRQEKIHLETGRLDLGFAEQQELTLTERTEPPSDLKDQRDVNRTQADDARLRELSAAFTTAPPPTTPTAQPAETTEERSIVTKMRRGGLTVLLDSKLGLGLMLLLAGAFGAAHALTPGHGKTLVAAYLVGQRGTVGHAFLLGLVTTITHTGIVIVLAALLPLILTRVAPERVQALLGFGGGLLIAGLGVWLLLRRLSGGADHVHIGGGGHHHHHGPGGYHHHHVPSGDRVRVWDLIVLGVSGGIVPCWDAIALLAMAIGTRQVWLGLPLLLAFSAGLAGVLVLIGVLVVKVKGFGSSRLGEGKLVRALPLLSAVAVTLLGVWLCVDAATGN